jgi:4-nitrophenyl phosphatase/NagD protein
METNTPKTLKDIRCFLLDMDGTFYLGNTLLPGAADFLPLLDEKGLSYLFLTNNSSNNRQKYAEKIRRLGVQVDDSAIFTSGEATAIYVRERKAGARVFLAGTPPLQDEFIQHGFQLVQDNPDYVVLGFDTTLTYDKLWKLSDHVRAGIPYIATHPDFNCPTETGYMPDIGAIIAFIKASTGRDPDVVIGKPNTPIVEAITRKTGLPVSALAMVGDRLYTDIALGQSGVMTILVLSGETAAGDLPSSPFKPDLVVDNLAGLAGFVRAL